MKTLIPVSTKMGFFPCFFSSYANKIYSVISKNENLRFSIVLLIEILSDSMLYYLEMFLSPPLLLLLCSLTSLLFRYTQNGILHMLDRNKRIKSKPERFQNCKDKFDLVITCEERVYDQVLEGEDFDNNVTEWLQLVI